jgi:hypothetical protein
VLDVRVRSTAPQNGPLPSTTVSATCSRKTIDDLLDEATKKKA